MSAYSNINRFARPGGWVEFQDWDTRIYSTDGSLKPDHPLQVFHTLTCDAQEAKGYSMSPGKHLEQWIHDAGFVNIRSVRYFLPLGTWPNDQKLVSIGGKTGCLLMLILE